MDLRVRPQLLSSYIAPIERRGCHRSMRLMRWLSQQLGDVADKTNGQVIMPYAGGHVQGKVKRRCKVKHISNDAASNHADDTINHCSGKTFPETSLLASPVDADMLALLQALPWC